MLPKVVCLLGGSYMSASLERPYAEPWQVGQGAATHDENNVAGGLQQPLIVEIVLTESWTTGTTGAPWPPDGGQGSRAVAEWRRGWARAASSCQTCYHPLLLHRQRRAWLANLPMVVNATRCIDQVSSTTV